MAECLYEITYFSLHGPLYSVFCFCIVVRMSCENSLIIYSEFKKNTTMNWTTEGHQIRATELKSGWMPEIKWLVSNNVNWFWKETCYIVLTTQTQTQAEWWVYNNFIHRHDRPWCRMTASGKRTTPTTGHRSMQASQKSYTLKIDVTFALNKCGGHFSIVPSKIAFEINKKML